MVYTSCREAPESPPEPVEAAPRPQLCAEKAELRILLVLEDDEVGVGEEPLPRRQVVLHEPAEVAGLAERQRHEQPSAAGEDAAKLAQRSRDPLRVALALDAVAARVDSDVL